MKRLTIGGGAVVALAGLFALGPREPVGERWLEPEVSVDLDAYLARSEASVPELRPEAAKAVVWADPEERSRTALALVYLHGFSADRHEIDPVVDRLADSLGANVYYARLAGHGQDGAAMEGPSVADWFDDAAEAIAVGRRLGDRIVLLGTSTGATLAVWAAHQREPRDALAALVLLSPNFQPKDRSSRVLLLPWGERIAKTIVGAERCWEPYNDAQAAHWTTCYPTPALMPMMALTEHVRTLDHRALAVPTLVLYSEQDEVVDATETERVYAEMAAEPKRLVHMGGGGDPSLHVLAGDILSPAGTPTMIEEVLMFLREADVWRPDVVETPEVEDTLQAARASG